MAKSFHNIIAEGTIEVSHQGEDVTLNLPEWLKAANGLLEDEEKLLEWATEQEILLPALQSGIQKVIIDIRAAARPNIDTKTGATKSIKADIENAQERIDNFVWKAVPKPGTKTKKSDAELLADMLANPSQEVLAILKAKGIELS